VSTPLAPKRPYPGRRAVRIEQRNTAAMLQWQKDDALDGYNSLTGAIRSRLTDHLSPSGSWILHIGANRILLFILNEECDIPNLRICVGIARDMTVSVFVENKVVSMDKLSWTLSRKTIFFQSYGCDICTVCNKSPVDILHSMLSSFVNIFMNNYTKRCNDQTCSSGGKKGDRKATRKLKTLT
jgi:hypothetical protein